MARRQASTSASSLALEAPVMPLSGCEERQMAAPVYLCSQQSTGTRCLERNSAAPASTSFEALAGTASTCARRGGERAS